MRFRTPNSRRQYASFPYTNAARGARNRRDLFESKLSSFHLESMRCPQPKVCTVLNTLDGKFVLHILYPVRFTTVREALRHKESRKALLVFPSELVQNQFRVARSPSRHIGSCFPSSPGCFRESEREPRAQKLRAPFEDFRELDLAALRFSISHQVHWPRRFAFPGSV
jgi:hypothetical protein